MKKVFLATLATSLITSSTFAFEPIQKANYFGKFQKQSNKFDINILIQNGILKDVILFDGRTININRDVNSLNFYDNKIDFLELRDGEIVDQLDINHLQIKLDGRTQRLLTTGVDGGG